MKKKKKKNEACPPFNQPTSVSRDPVQVLQVLPGGGGVIVVCAPVDGPKEAGRQSSQPRKASAADTARRVLQSIQAPNASPQPVDLSCVPPPHLVMPVCTVTCFLNISPPLQLLPSPVLTKLSHPRQAGPPPCLLLPPFECK